MASRVQTSELEGHDHELARNAESLKEPDLIVGENQSRCPDEISVHVGDVVVLGNRAPPEHRCSPAIVTTVAEAHCTVVVLDSSRRFGRGECWPGFEDIFPDSELLRLGTRVVIGDMQGTRTRHLNGLTGVISEHPRQGHPVFINKSETHATPQLAVCVVFDDCKSAKQRSALLEPRFLKAFDEVTLQTVQSLGEAVAMLSSDNAKENGQQSRPDKQFAPIVAAIQVSETPLDSEPSLASPALIEKASEQELVDASADTHAAGGQPTSVDASFEDSQSLEKVTCQVQHRATLESKKSSKIVAAVVSSALQGLKHVISLAEKAQRRAEQGTERRQRQAGLDPEWIYVPM